MNDDELDRLRNLPLRAYRPVVALRRPVSEVVRARFPVVDVHAHLGRWLTGVWAAPDVGALLATMDAANVETVVNLDGMWARNFARTSPATTSHILVGS